MFSNVHLVASSVQAAKGIAMFKISQTYRKQNKSEEDLVIKKWIPSFLNV